MTYTARVVPSLASLERDQWDLLDTADNPFLSYDFLEGLEQTGSIGPDSGWHPYHLAVFNGDQLLACAPTYAKDNSHGEFVFDWAWADAYQRNGMAYYPKLLTGVPYTPVTGPRLLVRKNIQDGRELKDTLVRLAIQACRDQGFSTWHCNFITDDDFEVIDRDGLLRRRDWQFHWENGGYRDFDQFLGRLRSRKRKSIRRERKRIADAGIAFEWCAGDELDEAQLDFVYDCYIDTFRNYGNYPALKPAFFRRVAAGLKDRFQVVFALRDQQRIAMAVFLAGGGKLYGRYWGCSQEIPGLHFETAYYQGIEFCIQNGIEVFESGAQGEHKIARGFLPTRTRSCHHVEHPVFRQAIGEHLEREKTWIDEYRQNLEAADPYRRDRQ